MKKVYEREGIEHKNAGVKRRKLSLLKNFFFHGLIFLVFGVLYIHLTMLATSRNFKLKNMTDERNALFVETAELKAKYETEFNLSEIENIAKNRLGMEFIKEINYVKLQD